jgi:hypothetical protein
VTKESKSGKPEQPKRKRKAAGDGSAVGDFPCKSAFCPMLHYTTAGGSNRHMSALHPEEALEPYPKLPRPRKKRASPVAPVSALELGPLAGTLCARELRALCSACPALENSVSTQVYPLPARARRHLAGSSLLASGTSSSEAASSSSSTESESETSPNEDRSESSVPEDADDDHDSAVEEDCGDAAIELAAAGVHSGTASEVMPKSGCAKRAGVTGKLDTMGAQSKLASEVTSSGQYPRLCHMSSVLLWEFHLITVMQALNQRTCTSRRASSVSLATMLNSRDWA